MGGRAAALVFQGFHSGPGSFKRDLFAALTFAISAFGTPARFLRHGAFAGRAQFHAGATGFGKSDRDSLFRGARPVFAFANVLHLFAHKLTGLRARSFAFARVATRAFDGPFFRHEISITSWPSPARACARNCGRLTVAPRLPRNCGSASPTFGCWPRVAARDSIAIGTPRAIAIPPRANAPGRDLPVGRVR